MIYHKERPVLCITEQGVRHNAYYWFHLIQHQRKYLLVVTKEEELAYSNLLYLSGYDTEEKALVKTGPFSFRAVEVKKCFPKENGYLRYDEN